MLFRTMNGNLIEIKKYDYPNDKIFYQEIMKIKKLNYYLNIENHFLKKDA